jgi:hypothetical protein
VQQGQALLPPLLPPFHPRALELARGSVGGVAAWLTLSRRPDSPGRRAGHLLMLGLTCVRYLPGPTTCRLAGAEAVGVVTLQLTVQNLSGGVVLLPHQRLAITTRGDADVQVGLRPYMPVGMWASISPPACDQGPPSPRKTHSCLLMDVVTVLLLLVHCTHQEAAPEPLRQLGVRAEALAPLVTLHAGGRRARLDWEPDMVSLWLWGYGMAWHALVCHALTPSSGLCACPRFSLLNAWLTR